MQKFFRNLCERDDSFLLGRRPVTALPPPGSATPPTLYSSLGPESFVRNAG